MSDMDELERQILEAARGALEPELRDKHRIHRMLTERLARGADFDGAAEKSSSTTESSALPPRGPGTASVVSAPLSSSAGSSAGLGWLKIAVAAILGGAVGFGAGYKTGQRAPAQPTEGTTTAVPAVTPMAGAPTTGAPPTPAADLLEERTPSPAGNALGAAAEPPRPSPAASDSSVPSRPPAAAEHETEASQDSVADPLYEELSRLRRAEQALRAGEPLLALGLLRELDENFPEGRLKEERAAARVMASCQRQVDRQAREQAAAFLATYPRSVYAERVQDFCGNLAAE